MTSKGRGAVISKGGVVMYLLRGRGWLPFSVTQYTHILVACSYLPPNSS